MTELGYLQDHADAFLGLVRAVPDLTVYPSEQGDIRTVPVNAPRQYLAVHFAGDRPLGSSLAARSSRFRLRAYCYCVAATDVGARAISDLVAGAVLGVRPVIPGRNCFPIRYETDHSRDPLADESIGTLVATLTEVYHLESVPGRDGS